MTADRTPTVDCTELDPGIVQREQVLLASYAMHSVETAGRRYAEPPHPYRGPFQRDRDRIVHSAAHRRLSAKMQVFTGEMGDYHRTRLTHTLEVASVARTVGRALRLNEDLVEALALAHDLGHPPFGHAGEDALNELLADEGGFSHNRQGLVIVEELEQRYPDFPGLNLSREVLEGQATRIDKQSRHQNPLAERPLLEVQVVEAADSVAYDTHDADDALHLGLLELDELLQLPLWAEAERRVRSRYGALADDRLKRAVLHELIDWQVSELIECTERRLAEGGIRSIDDVRHAPEILIGVGSELADLKRELETFLFQRVYCHPQVLRFRTEAQSMLREMFIGYVRCPELLPPRFAARVEQVGLRRGVADYIAGMTDRYAQQEYKRLFDRSSAAQSRAKTGNQARQAH
ncbi:MAG TPA: deoxyguanosinetriphosphate triphosphohydrolase [Pirellulales bacterium]|nr:deoxyguanosinetriphosphate triphosphohydrolase [Pirellulales bacterium]